MAERDNSRSRPVTMKDIARRAGVSTATVSRALQDDPSVTEATRATVRKEALEVGYVMHRQAQGLRSQRSGIIAVHVPFAERVRGPALSDPFVLEFVSVLGTSLHAAGLDMLVAQSATLDPALHRSRLVDGYVLLNHGDRQNELKQLTEAGVPIVVWVAPSLADGYCAVGPDNTALARAAVEHLLGLGRRRVGLIVDEIDSASTEGSLRFDGYRQALDDAGVAFDPGLVAVTTRREGAASEAVDQILRQAPDVDAVFVAFSDAMAVAVQRALIDRGKSVPDDVALVGFDNIGMGEFTHPRLTTIDPGLHAGVPLLIDKLTRQIRGESTTSEVVAGGLVIRESCGSTSTG